MNQYAVNPQTGEVAEFDGQAWKPVEKNRIAKNKEGGIAVLDGAEWRHIQDAPSAPQKTNGEEFTRGTGLGIRSLLEGLSAPIAVVGDAVNGVANLGIEGVNAVAGTNIPKFESYEQYTKRALDKALPTPETPHERIRSEAGRMIASVPSGMGVAKVGEMAGTKMLAPMAAAPLQQTVGAATGGTTYGVAKEETDNPWIQLAALVAGAMGGAGATAAVEGVANRVASSAPKAPSTAEIKSASNAAYKEADDLSNSDVGAILRPDPLKRITGEWQTYLADKTYRPALQPNLKVLIDDLNSASEGNITVKGLDSLRQVALSIIQKGDPKESMLAGNLIGRIDDLMTNLKPDDILQGDAQGVADALKKGGSLWKTFRKSEMVDDALYAADLKNEAANSGGNLHNKIKQAFTSILLDENKAKMFTAEEKAAMEKIVKGGWTQDTLRIVGRLAPSSNSQLGPILTQMGALGGPGYIAAGLPGAAAGVAVPLVGMGAKALANRSVLSAADRLSELVRRGALPPQVPKPQITGVDDATLARILMQGSSVPGLPGSLPLPLRSGPVSVPASDNRGKGPRNRP